MGRRKERDRAIQGARNGKFLTRDVDLSCGGIFKSKETTMPFHSTNKTPCRLFLWQKVLMAKVGFSFKLGG
jgi:hypothetical protein